MREALASRILFLILSYKSGTLNSLYKISLTEEIYYNERSDNHKTCGVVKYVSVKVRTGSAVRRSNRRRKLLIDIRQKKHLIGITASEEDTGVEIIRPLP